MNNKKEIVQILEQLEKVVDEKWKEEKNPETEDTFSKVGDKSVQKVPAGKFTKVGDTQKKRGNDGSFEKVKDSDKNVTSTGDKQTPAAGKVEKKNITVKESPELKKQRELVEKLSGMKVQYFK